MHLIIAVIFVISLLLIGFIYLYEDVLFKKQLKIELPTSVNEALILFLKTNSLEDVEVKYIENDFSMYQSKFKKIFLFNKVKDSQLLEDVYVSVHEGFHALQEKEGNLIFTSRFKWNERYKIKTAVLFIVLYLGSLLFQFIGEDKFYTFFLGIYFFLLLLINVLLIFPSEINASIRAYKYITKVYILSEKEKKKLRKYIYGNIRDYLVMLPYCIFI